MADKNLPKRTAFFVSDGTGITAETLGHSLLTQFEQPPFAHHSLRFVDTVERANAARRIIDDTAEYDCTRPVVFSTLVKPELREIVRRSNGFFLDFFGTYISVLEQELGLAASSATGRSHGMTDALQYSSRIEAVDFTLHHDDGTTTRNLDDADIILIGISRTGKTPTCLYLSLHYGVRAANFPLTDDDLETPRLPASLRIYRDKLFGLTTLPTRLQQIRHERLPDSRYASFAQCDFEIRQAEALFRRLGVPYLSTALKSIEEIAASIVDYAGIERPGRARRSRAHV